jgi:hypothetical protein
MDWADLFERAKEYETDVATIRERLAARRGQTSDPNQGADDA